MYSTALTKYISVLMCNIKLIDDDVTTIKY